MEPDQKSGLAAKLVRWLRQAHQSFMEKRTHRKEILGHLEKIVEIADPQIRENQGYIKAIYSYIEEIKDYCSSIISAIPGPLRLDKNSYFNDTTIAALFTSPDHLLEVIGSSPEVRGLRREGYHGDIVALLTMTKEEKTVFGPEQQGEMILQDVAQRAVNFTDHKLVAPAADLTSAQKGLSEHGLVVLATIAMEKITSLKSKVAGLREQQAYLEGAKKILSGKVGAHLRYTVESPAMQEELAKAEQRLAQTERELEETRRLYAGPADSLRYLVEILSHPEQEIVLRPQILKLNWMNVLVDNASGDGHEISLVEFSFPDDVKRSAIYVSLTI